MLLSTPHFAQSRILHRHLTISTNLNAFKSQLGQVHQFRGPINFHIQCRSQSTSSLDQASAAEASENNLANSATSTNPAHNSKETPLALYEKRVSNGKLRDDPYQRKIITSLSVLHQLLANYTPPKVSIPTAADLKPKNGGFRSIGKVFSSFFGKNGESGGGTSGSATATAEVIDFDRDYSNANGVRGIYLYGDVGCGKTMLMDLFYLTIPQHLPKMRVHFHQFMQKIHKRTHQLKVENRNPSGHDEIDVIPILAAEIANSATVLCFDEFQVTDVADAMLLRRLMMMLLSPEYGVVLFATSNRAPDDLYLNGIQRVSFIPCIQLIKHKCRVIFLNSPTDYRKIPKPLSSVYYWPKPGVKWASKANLANCKKHVDTWYEYFNQGNEDHHPHHNNNNKSNGESHLLLLEKKKTDYSLDVWGRKIHVPICSPPRVAQFTFFELCGTPMAAGDYLCLAEHFLAFIVTDIPFLSINERNQIRRFITFLDAVYDARGKIAVTSAAPFKDLFVEPEQLLVSGDHYELINKKQKEDSQENVTKPNTNLKSTSKSNLKSNSQTEDSFADDELVTKHGFDKLIAKKASLFVVNDEEKFAFARALSRLAQMSTTEWIDQD